jgi:hypothetical protein
VRSAAPSAGDDVVTVNGLLGTSDSESSLLGLQLSPQVAVNLPVRLPEADIEADLLGVVGVQVGVGGDDATVSVDAQVAAAPPVADPATPATPAAPGTPPTPATPAAPAAPVRSAAPVDPATPASPAPAGAASSAPAQRAADGAAQRRAGSRETEAPVPSAATSPPSPDAAAADVAPSAATPVATPDAPAAGASTERARAARSHAPEPQRPASAVTKVLSTATRSPWLPVGVVLAAVLYLLGQRRLDRGRKLSYAGRPGEPDDEFIEL